MPPPTPFCLRVSSLLKEPRTLGLRRPRIFPLISQSQKKPVTLEGKAIMCQVAADHHQEWVTPGIRNSSSFIEKRGVENSQPQTGVSQEGPAKVEMNQALDGLIERQNQFIQAEAANQAEKAKAAEFQKEKKRVQDNMMAQFNIWSETQTS
ncbi:hypothetical protein N7535_007232 [Penicillium sp. DV-2018c]|nr:hypothetical protein N7535_007232 [Penicillium sp. DV-2018c]